MKVVADLHLHSKYSRAVSPQMELPSLAGWAQKKGVNLLGTGDFSHPLWFNELKTQLVEAGSGFYRLRDDPSGVRFLLTNEISNIYSAGSRTRKVHNIVSFPTLAAVEKFNGRLARIGNLGADGRPILGLSARDLLEIALEVDPDVLFIPAHAWTPHFSVFGSSSGFDSLTECFGNLTPHIFAIETGLSSDPAMNWRLSALDEIALLSFSDAHSPSRLMREATVFEIEPNYSDLVEAIRSKDPKKLLYTIEFFPQEGKYHFDGHRSCKFSCEPEVTKAQNYLCPVCGRALTVGVLHRVEKLADRPAGFKPKSAIAFKNAIPLEQLIADVLGVGVSSQAVQADYEEIVAQASELEVLLNFNEGELKKVAGPQLALAILKARRGEVEIEPGYDGEFGKIKVFNSADAQTASNQQSLF